MPSMLQWPPLLPVATLNVSSGLPEEGDSLGLETVKAYFRKFFITTYNRDD